VIVSLSHTIKSYRSPLVSGFNWQTGGESPWVGFLYPPFFPLSPLNPPALSSASWLEGRKEMLLLHITLISMIHSLFYTFYKFFWFWSYYLLFHFYNENGSRGRLLSLIYIHLASSSSICKTVFAPFVYILIFYCPQEVLVTIHVSCLANILQLYAVEKKNLIGHIDFYCIYIFLGYPGSYPGN